MVLSQGFVEASITEEKPNSWVVRIVWSYYGISQWEECTVHTDINQAKDYLLARRCPQLKIIDRNKVVVNG
jgi:hypothetical protein